MFFTSDLHILQAGTAAFCKVGVAIVAYDGGNYGRDITIAQAKEAAAHMSQRLLY